MSDVISQTMSGECAQCDRTNIDILPPSAVAASSSSIMSISSRGAIMSILSPEIRSHNINISVCWPGDHPPVLSQCHIMSYHMTHVMFLVISLRCVAYQGDILPSPSNLYINWQIEFKEKFPCSVLKWITPPLSVLSVSEAGQELSEINVTARTQTNLSPQTKHLTASSK